MSGGWIGVDLDGTLAHYEHWLGEHHVGAPIPDMLQRVKSWLDQGVDVRIFTARVYPGSRTAAELAQVRSFIESWCLVHVGVVLPITHEKDYGMIELWDDRCVQVEKNTGRRMDGGA